MTLSWTIGAVHITRIVEREVPTRLQDLIPAATPQALAPHRDWLAPAFLDAQAEFCTLSLHALVIESDGKRIVVDTCMGEHDYPEYAVLDVPVEPFLDNLAAAGFPRESIDIVLCTHLHFDHVGWNTMRAGERWVPTFPNARYLFARTEWEHWHASEQREAWTRYSESVAPVVDAGLADFVDSDYVLTPEVRLESTPGHTPGHVSVRISSQGKQAFITGDMSHHPVQWAEPDWGTVADVDSAQGTASRRRVVAAYGDDANTLIIGTHYPQPCAGYLVSDGGRVILRHK
jgi:glyoxylase-like metal-dependent hydrolase (beta-lactamase superfamily II)